MYIWNAIFIYFICWSQLYLNKAGGKKEICIAGGRHSEDSNNHKHSTASEKMSVVSICYNSILQAKGPAWVFESISLGTLLPKMGVWCHINKSSAKSIQEEIICCLIYAKKKERNPKENRICDPRVESLEFTTFTLVPIWCRKYIQNGLPRWLSGKESSCQSRRHWFDPWVRKIPWRRKWQPTPVFLPGESQGQRSPASHSPRNCKESNAA